MSKPQALLFALLGASALVAISVSISFDNAYAIAISVIVFCLVMWIGFKLKRK